MKITVAISAEDPTGLKSSKRAEVEFDDEPFDAVDLISSISDELAAEELALFRSRFDAIMASLMPK